MLQGSFRKLLRCLQLRSLRGRGSVQLRAVGGSETLQISLRGEIHLLLQANDNVYSVAMWMCDSPLPLCLFHPSQH